MPEVTQQAVNLAEKFGSLWCVVMHDSAMWPIYGEYQCRRCGRRHPVPWAPEHVEQTPPSQAAVTSLRPATPVGTAFARHFAGLDQPQRWSPETVEVVTSLSKREKDGCVRATRQQDVVALVAGPRER